MRKCPKCGFSIENDNAKFCKKCGRLLPSIVPIDDTVEPMSDIHDNVHEQNTFDDNSLEIDCDDANSVKVVEEANATVMLTEANQMTDEKPQSFDITNSSQQIYTSEWLKENTAINGLLSFFLSIILIGGLYNAIYPIVTYNAVDYLYNSWIGAVDVILGLSLFGISIYIVYAFAHRKQNAVFYAISYLALVFATNLFAQIFGGEDDNVMLVAKIVLPCLWSGGLVLFLLLSKQVKEVLPRTFRKVSVLDWVIIAGVLIVPILCFCIGVAQIRSSYTEWDQDFLNGVLEENERSDGRIIFTVPEGFSCESEFYDTELNQSIQVFNLEDEGTATSCLICSDYDDDTSQTNFDEYWENWLNLVIDDELYSEVDEGIITVNGNKCRYRIVQIDSDDVLIYWRYYLLFDFDTGKCCVISCLDGDYDTSYIDFLLNSIRFQVESSPFGA